MLTSNDEGYIKRVTLMRLHGIGGDAWKRYSATGSWYYEVQDAGYKMNLCDILSALGRAQLKKVDQFWQERCQIRAKYDDAFRSMPELQLPPADAGDVHAWHLYILRIRPELLEVNRNQFIEELKKLASRPACTSSRCTFIPITLAPMATTKRTFRMLTTPFRAASRCRSILI